MTLDRDEHEDYPGLIVCNARMAGQITYTRSRLPVSTAFPYVLMGGWAEFEAGWDCIESDYGWTAERLGQFLDRLFEHRGEFARLLCVLADVQRVADEADEVDADFWPKSWYEMPEQCERVRAALAACFDTVESGGLS
jgi:hypothetical protein